MNLCLSTLLSLALSHYFAVGVWNYDDGTNAVNGCGTVCKNNNEYICLGTVASVGECISKCATAPKCEIMTWSSSTGNCWTRTDGVWDPVSDTGATAGCNNATVAGCAGPPAPWNGTNLTATVSAISVGSTHLRSPAVTLDIWRWDDVTFGEKWGNSSAQEIDLSNPTLRALTASLAPGLIRIGGSPDDSIVFDVDGTCVPGSGGNGPAPPPYYCSQVHPYVYDCLTPQRWEALLEFANDTGMQIAFGLNGCYGRMSADTAMDFSNAQALINATASSRYASSLWGFEISNEVVPNTISAAAWSADAATLASYAASAFAAAGLPPPPFAGPAQGGCGALGEVADLIRVGVLGALTYHEYPECTAEDPTWALSPLCLGLLDSQAVQCVAAGAAAPGPPYPEVWAGETADHSGGGIPGLTDTFRSSIYYAWQLGALPVAGVPLAARQCLSGGDYELLQRVGFDPNPDFWVAWLFKSLIGGAATVYPVALSIPGNQSGVRIFAFSAAAPTNGSLALIAINTRSAAEDGGQWPQIAVSLESDAWPFSTSARMEYHLSAANISTRHGPVLCNGVQLTVDPVTHQPQPWQQVGVERPPATALVLQPASVTFVTLL